MTARRVRNGEGRLLRRRRAVGREESRATRRRCGRAPPGRVCHVSRAPPPHRHPPQPELHSRTNGACLLPQPAVQPRGGAGGGVSRGRDAPWGAIPRSRSESGSPGPFCARRRRRGPGAPQPQSRHPQESAFRRRTRAGAGRGAPLPPRRAAPGAAPRASPAAEGRPPPLRAVPASRPRPPGRQAAVARPFPGISPTRPPWAWGRGFIKQHLSPSPTLDLALLVRFGATFSAGLHSDCATPGSASDWSSASP